MILFFIRMKTVPVVLPFLLFLLQVKSNLFHGINKRTLIFPQAAPTRTQFIAGIGIPLELQTQSVVTGYVLKTQYLLPFNASALRIMSLFPTFRFKRNLDIQSFNENITEINNSPANDTKSNINEYESTFSTENDEFFSYSRWIAYSGLEYVFEKYGYPGRECLLKSICESASVPFSGDHNLLAEWFHILLTPSTSLDPLQNSSQLEYITAERAGRNTKSKCNELYSSCKISFLNLLSVVI